MLAVVKIHLSRWWSFPQFSLPAFMTLLGNCKENFSTNHSWMQKVFFFHLKPALTLLMQTVCIGSLLVIDIFFFNSKNRSRFYFVNWLSDIFHPFLKSQFIAGRFEKLYYSYNQALSCIFIFISLWYHIW